MHMIPDAAPLAQPTELYRVDIATGNAETGSVIFNATEAEVDTEALRIVTAEGGDHGDIYQHTGAGRGTYYGTVAVDALTREDIVAAIVDGDRTEQELRDRFGVRLDRLLKGGERALFHFLHGLVIEDLLFMEQQFRRPGWLYKPTKKGRELVKARQGGVS